MHRLPKPKPNKSQLDRLSTVLSNIALGSPLFFALGLSNMDNYLHWLYFSLSMAAAGMVLAVILYGIICWFVPGAGTYKNDNGNGIFIAVAFSSVMLCFGGGVFVNKTWIASEECRTFTIESFGESGGKTRAYYVFIDGNIRKERVSLGETFNNTHKAGDKVDLSIVTGYLGFQFYKLKCNQ